ISIPLQAIGSARDGRGRLAVQQLESVLGAITKCEEDTAHIRVWPQYIESAGGDAKKVSRPVSLSWWLSTPLQVHLHQQLENTKKNLETTKMDNPNRDPIEKTWRALEATSACIAARRGATHSTTRPSGPVPGRRPRSKRGPQALSARGDPARRSRRRAQLTASGRPPRSSPCSEHPRACRRSPAAYPLAQRPHRKAR